MSALRDVLEKLLERKSLAQSQAQELFTRLTEPDTAPALAGAILAALRMKGVTAEEVRGFALAMRCGARRPHVPPDLGAIDIVGTGGDSSGSLNISTGSALLTAACGVPVLKHGNRSISSRAGSADVLEALGLTMPLDERAAGRCFAACNFTFLFAPHYHPAMQTIAAVRAALGVRTVFNLLGPLTNPAEPPFALIGAYSKDAAALIAQTLSGMQIERAFVVHGAEDWDEPTPIGPFTVYDVCPGRITVEVRHPLDYGFAPCTRDALAGGDARYNAQAIQAALGANQSGAYRDCLVLGTALALEICGRARHPREAVECAMEAIESGAAQRVLECLASFATREQSPCRTS